MGTSAVVEFISPLSGALVQRGRPVGAKEVGQECDELIFIHGFRDFAMINVGPSQLTPVISSSGRKPDDR